jgi:hypothetical protein
MSYITQNGTLQAATAYYDPRLRADKSAIIISPDNPEGDMKLTVVPEIYLLDAPPVPVEPEPMYINAECEPAPKPIPEPCARFVARGVLLVPRDMEKLRGSLRRIPSKCGKPVSCRIVVEFSVKGSLNMELWKKLKIPPPWHKAPRNQWKNTIHYPVRLYCYQPAELSKEQVEFLQAQIALMEIA